MDDMKTEHYVFTAPFSIGYMIESVESYYTGDGDTVFADAVSVSSVGEYISSAERIETRTRRQIHRVFVIDMPIGDEKYTGDLYLKYFTNQTAIENTIMGIEFYSQFDISIPRVAVDGMCLIMEGVDGVVMDAETYISEPVMFDSVFEDKTVLDSLITDIALFIVGGHVDYGLGNIVITDDTYSFVEFSLYESGSNPFRALMNLPYYFTDVVQLQYPYAIVTMRAYDISKWLLKTDEVYVPSGVERNCENICSVFPVGHPEFVCGDSDPWAMESLGIEDGMKK